jgi:hypothetical protein
VIEPAPLSACSDAPCAYCAKHHVGTWRLGRKWPALTLSTRTMWCSALACVAWRRNTCWSVLGSSRSLLPPFGCAVRTDSCRCRWWYLVCRREKFCDFCNCELPDWKNVLTPTLGNTAPAVMNVNFDNKTYSFHVAPGGSHLSTCHRWWVSSEHMPQVISAVVGIHSLG